MNDLSDEQLERAAGVLRTLSVVGELSPSGQKLLARVRISDPLLANWVDRELRTPRPDPNLYFGRYRLSDERPIRTKECGVEVWRGQDVLSEEKVAIKRYHNRVTAGVTDHLRRVYDAVLPLRHPNIVRVLAHGIHPTDGSYYIVTEWGGDRTWQDRIEEWAADPSTRPPAAALAGWMRQVADGIEYAYQAARLVHADLKPTNILFSDIGIPKIVDWDSAQHLGPKATGVWRATDTGTPGYAAPEQLAGGKLTHRTDVYGLGATLYHSLCLTHPPIPVEKLSVWEWRQWVSTKPPPTLPDNESPLAQIARQCLWKHPSCRYRTARELAYDLARAETDQPVYARRRLTMLLGTVEFLKCHPRTRQALTLTATLLVGMVAVAQGSFALQRHNEWRANRTRSALLEKFDSIDLSPDTRALAVQGTRYSPNDPVMALAPAAVDLFLALTKEQHDQSCQTAERQLRDQQIPDQTAYFSLFSKFAELHLVLVQMIDQGARTLPPVRTQLVEVVTDIERRLDGNPKLSEIVDTISIFRRLYTISHTLRWSVTKSDDPPEPFRNLPAKSRWMYWTATAIESAPPRDATADLHYLHAGCVMQLLCESTTTASPADRLQWWRRASNALSKTRATPRLSFSTSFSVKARTFEITCDLVRLRTGSIRDTQLISDVYRKISTYRRDIETASIDEQLFGFYSLLGLYGEIITPTESGWFFGEAAKRQIRLKLGQLLPDVTGYAGNTWKGPATFAITLAKAFGPLFEPLTSQVVWLLDTEEEDKRQLLYPGYARLLDDWESAESSDWRQPSRSRKWSEYSRHAIADALLFFIPESFELAGRVMKDEVPPQEVSPVLRERLMRRVSDRMKRNAP